MGPMRDDLTWMYGKKENPSLTVESSCRRWYLCRLITWYIKDTMRGTRCNEDWEEWISDFRLRWVHSDTWMDCMLSVIARWAYLPRWIWTNHHRRNWLTCWNSIHWSGRTALSFRFVRCSASATWRIRAAVALPVRGWNNGFKDHTIVSMDWSQLACSLEAFKDSFAPWFLVTSERINLKRNISRCNKVLCIRRTRVNVASHCGQPLWRLREYILSIKYMILMGLLAQLTLAVALG